MLLLIAPKGLDARLTCHLTLVRGVGLTDAEDAIMSASYCAIGAVVAAWGGDRINSKRQRNFIAALPVLLFPDAVVNPYVPSCLHAAAA